MPTYDRLLKEDGELILQEDGFSAILLAVALYVLLNNYMFVRVGDGMSTSEKIR